MFLVRMMSLEAASNAGVHAGQLPVHREALAAISWPHAAKTRLAITGCHCCRATTTISTSVADYYFGYLAIDCCFARLIIGASFWDPYCSLCSRVCVNLLIIKQINQLIIY